MLTDLFRKTMRRAFDSVLVTLITAHERAVAVRWMWENERQKKPPNRNLLGGEVDFSGVLNLAVDLN